jgi:undecaprenyl-diphosphatase
MDILSNRKLGLIVAALASLWLAMLLIGGPGSAVDLKLLSAAQLPGLIPAARIMTRLGDWTILLPIGLVAAALIVLRGHPRRGAVYLLLIISGRVLVELQKAQFDRARPDPHGHIVAVHSMAFPSGHAAHSMTAWLGIALLAVASPRLRGPAILLALALTLLTGLSRLVLAVHWPSDVVGGWAFGAAWTLLMVRLVTALEAPAVERLADFVIEPVKESIMSDRTRADDSALIDEMEDAPSHGGTAGGNLQRDVASQAEEEHEVGGATGVTRVTGEDKPAGGDEPTLPRRD